MHWLWFLLLVVLLFANGVYVGFYFGMFVESRPKVRENEELTN